MLRVSLRQVDYSVPMSMTSNAVSGPGRDGKFHIVRQAQQPRRTLLHRAPKSDTSLGLSPGPMERTLSQLHIFCSTTGTRWVSTQRCVIALRGFVPASIRGGGTGILLGYGRRQIHAASFPAGWPGRESFTFDGEIDESVKAGRDTDLSWAP
jgi:hypothetical protein